MCCFFIQKKKGHGALVSCDLRRSTRSQELAKISWQLLELAFTNKWSSYPNISQSSPWKVKSFSSFTKWFKHAMSSSHFPCHAKLLLTLDSDFRSSMVWFSQSKDVHGWCMVFSSASLSQGTRGFRYWMPMRPGWPVVKLNWSKKMCFTRNIPSSQRCTRILKKLLNCYVVHSSCIIVLESTGHMSKSLFLHWMLQETSKTIILFMDPPPIAPLFTGTQVGAATAGRSFQRAVEGFHHSGVWYVWSNDLYRWVFSSH